MAAQDAGNTDLLNARLTVGWNGPRICRAPAGFFSTDRPIADFMAELGADRSASDSGHVLLGAWVLSFRVLVAPYLLTRVLGRSELGGSFGWF